MSQLPDEKDSENVNDDDEPEVFHDMLGGSQKDDDVLFVRRGSDKSGKAYHIHELSTFNKNNVNGQGGGDGQHYRDETGMNLWESQSGVGDSIVHGHGARSIVSPPQSTISKTYNTYRTGRSYGSESESQSDVTGAGTTIVKNDIDEIDTINDDDEDNDSNYIPYTHENPNSNDINDNNANNLNNLNNVNQLNQPQPPKPKGLELKTQGTMIIHSDVDDDDNNDDDNNDNEQEADNSQKQKRRNKSKHKRNRYGNNNNNNNNNGNYSDNENLNYRSKTKISGKSTHPESSMISSLSKKINNVSAARAHGRHQSNSYSQSADAHARIVHIPDQSGSHSHPTYEQTGMVPMNNNNSNNNIPMNHGGQMMNNNGNLNVINDSEMDIASYGTVKSLMTTVLDTNIGSINRPTSQMTPTHLKGSNNDTFDSAAIANLEQVYILSELEKQMTDTESPPLTQPMNRHTNNNNNNNNLYTSRSDEYVQTHGKFPYNHVNLYGGNNNINVMNSKHQLISSSTLGNSPQTPQLISNISPNIPPNVQRVLSEEDPRGIGHKSQKSHRSHRTDHTNTNMTTTDRSKNKESLHYSGSDEGIDSELSSLSRQNEDKNPNKQRRLSALTRENLLKYQMNDHGNGVYSDYEFIRANQARQQQQHQKQVMFDLHNVNNYNNHNNNMYNNNHIMNNGYQMNNHQNNYGYSSNYNQQQQQQQQRNNRRRNINDNTRLVHSAHGVTRFKGIVGNNNNNLRQNTHPRQIAINNGTGSVSSEERQRRRLIRRHKYEHSPNSIDFDSHSRSPGLASVSEESDDWPRSHSGLKDRSLHTGQSVLSPGLSPGSAGINTPARSVASRTNKSMYNSNASVGRRHNNQKTREEKKKEQMIKYAAIGAAVAVVIVVGVVLGRSLFSKSNTTTTRSRYGARVRRAPRRY